MLKFLFLKVLLIGFAYNLRAEIFDDTLKNTVVQMEFPNLTYFPEIEKPLLAAIQYFPELQHVEIKFDFKNIKTTMVSRPRISSLWKKNKTFVIYIDNKVKNNHGIAYQNIPDEAKIGLIGHELCHIVDYQSKNKVQILKMGLHYAFSSKHYAIESHVDKLTIAKGLGPQLYIWTDFVLNHSEATEKYKNFKKINYLALTEILIEIEKLNLPAQ